MSIKHLDKIVSLCKRKGFVFPNSEIYGGLKASYDYGPLGVELKKAISEKWWVAMTNNANIKNTKKNKHNCHTKKNKNIDEI